jgi:hypothetical protein
VTAPPASDASSLNGQPPSSSRRSVPLLGFRQPAEPEPTIPSPASSPEAEEQLDELASELDWSDDEPTDESAAGTGSPGSGTRVANPLVGNALRDTFRNGVIIASHQAHSYLTRTAGQIEAGLYLADEDDAANIGDPLARITARREGLGQVNPDTADLLAAMMGLAGYASKQIQKTAVSKKIDARYAGAEDVQHLPTQPGDV